MDVKRASIAGADGEIVAAEEARGEVVGHDGAIAAGVDDLDLASLSHG